MPPLVPSGAATQARGSSEMPASRWLFIRCLTTRLAVLNAPSGSPALIGVSCSMFRGASAWSCGAPPSIALKMSVTAGSGSQSTATASTPSWAA
jgi:hypothetical protein